VVRGMIQNLGGGMREYRARELKWDGPVLRLGMDGRFLAALEAAPIWPGMYRVRTLDGCVSDMLNRTRAKDAAVSLALAMLNHDRGRMAA
jgi:hypothetical protein